MICKVIGRGLVVAVVVPSLFGCVAYGTYRKTYEELERSKAAHRDLIAKYNRDVNRHGPIQTTIQGVPESEHERVKMKLAQLQEELRREKSLRPNFTTEDADHVGNDARLEDGGIALGSGLLFNAGEAQLKSSQLPQLDRLAEVLENPQYAGNRFIIEGHTDNQPLKSVKNLFSYNINLGYERAYSVFKYLEKKHGMREGRFSIVTFGMTRPVDPATKDTEDGRRENRRVVIRLAGEKI